MASTDRFVDWITAIEWVDLISKHTLYARAANTGVSVCLQLAQDKKGFRGPEGKPADVYNLAWLFSPQRDCTAHKHGLSIVDLSHSFK